MSGKKIIEGLQDAIAGNISRETVVQVAKPMTPQADSGSVEGLRACPFCGGEGDVSFYATVNMPAPAGYFVECGSCSACGEPFKIQGEMPDREEYTKAEAIAAWNRRAEPTPPPPVEGGWRPIESAPKDGTAILIRRPTDYITEEGHHVVRWDDDWWQVHDGKFDHPLRGPDPAEWAELSSDNPSKPTPGGDGRWTQAAPKTPGQADVRETGWLIEHESDPKWWTGWPIATDDAFWTKDSLTAIRFSRRADAENLALYHLGEGPYRITDHQWSDGRCRCSLAAPPEASEVWTGSVDAQGNGSFRRDPPEGEVGDSYSLSGALHRLLGVAQDFVRESSDPGTEALAAIYCAEVALSRQAATTPVGEGTPVTGLWRDQSLGRLDRIRAHRLEFRSHLKAAITAVDDEAERQRLAALSSTQEQESGFGQTANEAVFPRASPPSSQSSGGEP